MMNNFGENINYETHCVKIKLKPNSLAKVREWQKTINNRKDEALVTLRDEKVILECIFLDQTSEGDFLIYVMKVESFEKVKEVFEKSINSIDEYHQNFKSETWAEKKNLELLVDLENFNKK